MAPSPDEPTRWSRIRAADYEYLVERWQNPIRRFLASRLSGREDAEEATQDLFVVLVSRDVLARAEEAKGSFRSFLFHVARQFLIDRYRSREASSRRPAEPLPEEAALPGAEPSPEDAFDREWWLSLFNAARRSLKAECEEGGRPEVYRAFRLFFFGDGSAGRLSYQDIAAATDSTFGLVKKRIERGRAAFLRHLRSAVTGYARSELEVEEELRDLGRFLERHRLHALPPSSILAAPEPVDEAEGG